MGRMNTKPLLKQGGGAMGWNNNISHLLVLGQTGSGKSVVAQAILANLYVEERNNPPTTKSMLVACDPKAEDWLFAEESPNCFFGDDSYKAIEVAYNELEARKANKELPRPPLILFCDELTSLVESLPSKQKKETQHQLKIILLQGRSIGIRLLCVSQDLMADVLGNSSLRNQFGAVLGLGSMASRSAVASNIFDLELGQKLPSLPKQFGWYQVFDGSEPIKIKVATIINFQAMQKALLSMLSLYNPTQ